MRFFFSRTHSIFFFSLTLRFAVPKRRKGRKGKEASGLFFSLCSSSFFSRKVEHYEESRKNVSSLLSAVRSVSKALQSDPRGGGGNF